ncbi:MAG: hypothetical protein H6742_13125 [Alphaproteobacteria bacterium]|nr:hypothetical protein [Alphaproteobacteria bacterium]
MKISGRLRVADLLEEFPEVDEVFESHDVEITDELMDKTLSVLCRTEGIDWIDLKADLREAVGWDGSAEFDDEEEEEEEDWYEESEEEEEEAQNGDDLDLGDDDLDDDDDDDEDGEDDDEDEDEELDDDDD